MTLPVAGTITPSNFDATVDPDAFSAEAQLLATEWEDLKALWDAVGGPIIADAEGHAPAATINPNATLAALLTVDGTASLLDADRLDGLEGENYLRSNGSQTLSLDSSTIFTVEKAADTTDTLHTALSIRAAAAGRGAGFGVAALWRASNAAGTITDAGRIGAEWDDATNGSEDSRLSFATMVAGTLTQGASLWSGVWEMLAVGSPAGAAPSGTCWLWFDDDEGTLKIRPGSGDPDITLGASAGVPAHDHDADYLQLDGTSAMTGTLDLNGQSILFASASAPSTPGTAGDVIVYVESSVLKYKDSSGTVTTVGNTPTNHADFADLASDHHTQYVLRQPTADTVINASGGDFDWTFTDDAGGALLKLDAGAAAVGVGGASINTTARLFVESASARDGISVLAVSGTGINVEVSAGIGLNVNVGDAGRGALFTRSTIETVSSPVVAISDGALGTNTGGALLVQGGATASSYVARFEAGGIPAEVVTIADDEMVINDLGGTYVFRVEGDTLPNLLRTIPASDVVTVNHASLATARFNVDGGDLDAIFARTSQSGKAAVVAQGNSVAYGVKASSFTGNAIDATVGEESGLCGYFYRDLAGGTGELVAIATTSSTDTATLLTLDGAGTGNALSFVDEGTYTFGVISSSAASDRGGILEFLGFATEDTVPDPASGHYRLYFRDGELVHRNSDGDESVVGAGGGIVTADNGAERKPDKLEGVVTTAAGASSLSTATHSTPAFQGPAGALIERVLIRVTSAVNITGGTGGIDIGFDGDEAAFGSAIATTDGTTNLTAVDFPAPIPIPGSGTLPFKIRPAGGVGTFADNSGTISIVAFFVRFTAPTS